MLDRVFAKLQETEEKAEGIVAQLAKAATERLQNAIIAGEREQSPSDIEVEALRQKARMVCRVGLPDGSYKSVLVDAWTTIKELIPQLARLARLGDERTDLGLFETLPPIPTPLAYPLRDESFVADAMTRWEAMMSIKGNKPKDTEFTLRLRKKIFTLAPDESPALSTDAFYTDFMFNQVHISRPLFFSDSLSFAHSS